MLRSIIFIITMSLGLTSISVGSGNSKYDVELTSRNDIVYFQDEMDMNLTQRFHIEYFQDLSDHNITKRHHIAFLQDESDYNITKRHHIAFIQNYVSDKCAVQWFKGCLIYN